MRARPLLALLLAVSLAGSAIAADPAPVPAAAAAASAAVPVPGAAAAADAPVPAAAASAAPAPAAAPLPRVATAVQSSPVTPSAGGLMQTIFGLCLVLGLLFALAWFLKRHGPRHVGQSAHLRIVGALNLGGRERVIVVEVGEQWIVVGASPGRVNALATLPRQADTPGPAVLDADAPSASSFSEWLKQTIEKRK